MAGNYDGYLIGEGNYNESLIGEGNYGAFDSIGVISKFLWLLTASGIPVAGKIYLWEDEETWDDIEKWTED